MMGTPKRLFSTAVTCLLGMTLPLAAGDLSKATITQTVNQVNVSNAQGGNVRSASPGMAFAVPELLRTGPASRAELVSADKTVTRVGSNTVFSFKGNQRGINLRQGCVLFHSPSGEGGGEVQTTAATAAVLGTTIIVSCTSNGGFKFLVLEGDGRATLPNGKRINVKAGYLTFIMPGANRIPHVFEFRLSAQFRGSALIHGFQNNTPEAQAFINNIKAAIEKQEGELEDGEKEDTGYLLGDTQNLRDVEIVDANTRTAWFDSMVEEEKIEEDDYYYYYMGGGGGVLVGTSTIVSSTGPVTMSYDIFQGTGDINLSNVQVGGLDGYTGVDVSTAIANDGTLNIQNLNVMSGVTSTRLEAATIVLNNAALQGFTVLTSLTGMPQFVNNNGNAVYGAINFVGGGNTYNGNQISNMQQLQQQVDQNPNDLHLRDKDGVRTVVPGGNN